jgi:hypothetical protein
MRSSTVLRSILCSSLLFALSAGIEPASADSSHARVIRLSLVQGDVRFTRESHGDPLADQKAQWETAQANLPVRQGYVVATDKSNLRMAQWLFSTRTQFSNFSIFLSTMAPVPHAWFSDRAPLPST